MIITAKNIIKQCVINKVSQIEDIDTDVVLKEKRFMRDARIFVLLKIPLTELSYILMINPGQIWSKYLRFL